jgi:membrane protein
MQRWIKSFAPAARAWNSDNAFKHSAAVSFYTLFSLAPIMIIALAVAGFFFGREAAQGQIKSQLTQLVGKDSAQVIQDTVAKSEPQSVGWLSTAIGIGAMLVGATTVFGQMQDSFNEIWGVTAKPSRSGLIVLLVQRLISFAMVLTIGFLLLVSLVLTTALTGFVNYVGGEWSHDLLQVADFSVGLVIVTVLFALLFKVLPDVQLRWSDVWLGALVTALLFVIGRLLIAYYLGHSTVASSYGAAGSLVALLVWIYYSSAILFFGVEWTHAYCAQGNRRVLPKETAVRVRREILK